MAQPAGVELGDVQGMAPQLRLSLLDADGHSGIPWKLLPGGVSPAPTQHLNPYGIWITEVMKMSASTR